MNKWIDGPAGVALDNCDVELARKVLHGEHIPDIFDLLGTKSEPMTLPGNDSNEYIEPSTNDKIIMHVPRHNNGEKIEEPSKDDAIRAPGNGSDLIGGMVMMSAGKNEGGDSKKTGGSKDKGENVVDISRRLAQRTVREKYDLVKMKQGERSELAAIERANQMTIADLKIALKEAIKISDEKVLYRIITALLEKGEVGFVRSHKSTIVRQTGKEIIEDSIIASDMRHGWSLEQIAKGHPLAFIRQAAQRRLKEYETEFGSDDDEHWLGTPDGPHITDVALAVRESSIEVAKIIYGTDLMESLGEAITEIDAAAIQRGDLSSTRTVNKAVDDIYFLHPNPQIAHQLLKEIGEKNIIVWMRVGELEVFGDIVRRRLHRELSREDVEAYELLSSVEGDLSRLDHPSPMVQFWADVMLSSDWALLFLPGRDVKTDLHELGMTPEAIKAEIESHGGDVDKASAAIRERALFKMRELEKPKKE